MIPLPTSLVMSEVAAERARQDEKWGEQNHPNATGPLVTWASDFRNEPAKKLAELATQRCQTYFADGHGAWIDIALEEVAEAFAEQDPAKLRTELIQCAAVFVAWIEAIDRRSSSP